MTKQCTDCDKSLYSRNKTGYCAPCRMRRLNADDEINRRRQVARLSTVAARPIAERLDKFRVQLGDDECWGWTGAHNGVGYGVLTVHSQVRMATHLALESDGRPRPSTKHVACHSCDNPPCTNPRHLWWGTEKENMQDSARKGRLNGRRTRSIGAPVRNNHINGG